MGLPFLGVQGQQHVRGTSLSVLGWGAGHCLLPPLGSSVRPVCDGQEHSEAEEGQQGHSGGKLDSWQGGDSHPRTHRGRTQDTPKLVTGRHLLGLA